MCDEEDTDFRKTSAENVTNYQAVPDAEREMASTAHLEFEEGKYIQCLATLRKLQFKRPQDLKVLHNISVVEYYCSDCKDTENFRKNILEVCKQAHINMEDTDALDDVDNSVLVYNQAAVLYHLHQYNAALHVLERVIQFLEPLDETLARNICLLLIDSYLNVFQPKRLSGFVPHMETSYFSNNKNCGKNNSKEKEGQKDETDDSCISEHFKRRFQLCKARLFATLKTSKACKREIKNLMSSGSGIQNISAFFLKSQLEYQRGNYRKALKLLHSSTLPTDMLKYFRETGDCLPVLFYNNVGCIHFYMGKPHLGKFYTKKAVEEFENHIRDVTDQNKLSDNALNSRPLHLLGLSTCHQLLYNLGLQCMQGQNFEEAFNYFIQVLRLYYLNPRLWLRVAECCIQIDKPNNMKEYVDCKKVPSIKTVIGSGPHRKIILNSLRNDSSSEDVRQFDKDEITPSLHFAMLCLKNAQALLPEHQPAPFVYHTSLPGAIEEGTASDENHHLSVFPSTFILGSEIISLRNSILVSSSYVSLCLGDVLMAHEYAKLLLSQPRVSSAHKFLAHMYNGEALLVMDRITETIEHFNIQHDSEIELAFPASSSEVSLKHQMRFDSKLSEKNDDGSRPVGNIPNWFPNTIASAKCISLHNLAVAYAVREEWSKALECLQQMSSNETVPLQARNLLMYVQLLEGTADDLHTYIKQSAISGYS